MGHQYKNYVHRSVSVLDFPPTENSVKICWFHFTVLLDCSILGKRGYKLLRASALMIVVPFMYKLKFATSFVLQRV